MKFRYVKEVFAAVETIAEKLSLVGEAEAATSIRKTMKIFWTTTSEALDLIIQKLRKIRPIVVETLSPSDVQFLDETVNGAIELFNHPQS